MDNSELNKLAIRLGTFFFKYRNKVFPIMVAALFLFAPQAKAVIVQDYTFLFTTKDLIAFLIILSGLTVRAVVIGFAYIKRGGLNKKVYADKLVTEGIFNICRNPLYVGNMLICIGIFALHQNPLVGALGVLIYFGIYQCIILTEEKYLREKFGKDYDLYCKKTPRWIPDLAKFPAAIKGMHFNIKRVIIKDYTTIATATISFLVIKLYQNWYVTSSSQTANYIFLMLFIGVAVAAVRFMKKKKIIKE